MSEDLEKEAEKVNEASEREEKISKIACCLRKISYHEQSIADLKVRVAGIKSGKIKKMYTEGDTF